LYGLPREDFLTNTFLFSIALLASSYNLDPQDVYCMSEAIYFEARGESIVGQIAVGNVALNRVHSKRFPNTVCKVVHQGVTYKGHMIRNKCQFSYYCDGRPEKIKDAEAFVLASQVAVDVLLKHSVVIKYATHYHNVSVRHAWSKDYTLLRKIGKHVFYK